MRTAITLCIFCQLLIGLKAPAADQPNVLLILADDLGYGDVGFQGCRDIPTPHLDSLARDGVRFTSGYSSHPFCSPMRAGLMSCRYQHRFGYVTNVAFDPHNHRMGLPNSEITIAERLQKAGYRTGMVGKWHLGAAAPFHPLSRGFDFFFGFLGGGHDYFVVDTTTSLQENYKAALDDNGQPAGLSGYLTNVLTDQALRFLKQPSDDKPYFLYVAYNAPHGPLQAPEEAIAKFSSIDDRKRRIYAAMVNSMDEQIGRLLDEIDRRGEREKTLVVFLSDNGGPENANASDNGALRGQKGDVFEGGIRVPFVMRMQGTLPSGIVYSDPVISLDVSRTALELAGAEIDAKLEGVNLVPYVRSEKKSPPHEAIFWRMSQNQKIAVRRGNDKWTVIDGKASLYSIDDDISESKDLIESRPQVASDLKAIFERWNAENQATFFPEYRVYHERLKAFHLHQEESARGTDSQ